MGLNGVRVKPAATPVYRASGDRSAQPDDQSRLGFCISGAGKGVRGNSPCRPAVGPRAARRSSQTGQRPGAGRSDAANSPEADYPRCQQGRGRTSAACPSPAPPTPCVVGCPCAVQARTRGTCDRASDDLVCVDGSNRTCRAGHGGGSRARRDRRRETRRLDARGFSFPLLEGGGSMPLPSRTVPEAREKVCYSTCTLYATDSEHALSAMRRDDCRHVRVAFQVHDR